MNRPAWLDEWTNKTVLPGNATNLELSLEKVYAERIEGLSIRIRDLWNPETCPEEYLPWLAWAWHVDAWNDLWTVAQKRSFIKNNLYIHNHKGTLASMRKIMESFGYSFRIVEWFDMSPVGDPYTFDFQILTPDAVTDEIYNDIEQIVLDAKSLRSQLANFVIGTEVRGRIGTAMTFLSGEHTEHLGFFFFENDLDELDQTEEWEGSLDDDSLPFENTLFA